MTTRIRPKISASAGPLTTRDPDVNLPEHLLASSNELSDFLAEVEHRAFKQAVFAVRDRDSALDLVQDAMLRLSSKYGDHPASEFPMLFQRILQNAIRDWYRRQKVRSAWGVLLSSLSTNRDDEDFDPLESMDLTGKAEMPELPLARMERRQVIETIQKEVEKLPARQREAFLLRYWEELDVADTAAAMGCSEGSVKTHCSRAAHTLASALRAKGIEP